MINFFMTAATLTALYSGSAFAQCDMGNVGGCEPIVAPKDKKIAQCDIADVNGCGPVAPVSKDKKVG